MHYGFMKRHSDIIRDAEAVRRMHSATGAPIHTIRSWGHRDSIPAQHWQAIADAEIATLEELALAAAARISDEPQARVA